MKPNHAFKGFQLRCYFTLSCLLLASSVLCQAAVVVYVDEQGGLFTFNRPDVNEPLAAVEALATVPSIAEAGRQLSSGVLAGTKVLALQTAGGTTTVEFSQDILGGGLDEARLTTVFDQVRATLRQFSLDSSIRLQAGGKLLSSYLPPVQPVEPGPSTKAITPNLVGSALSGKKITLGPSHGRYWVGFWAWQRSDPCGFGDAVLEDCNSIRLVQFLSQYLSQDGATVYVARQLDESDCCNTDTGLPWWKMCASTWLHHAGLPCSVWASSSGNCGADTATDRNSDDIRARPLFADYHGSDLYIAHHTNAGGGTGTETYRDTAMEHPEFEAGSYTLASSVHNNVIAAIRDMYDGAWADRGVKDSAGSFGEIRIPSRPACLIELAFHDNCTRDALDLTDDFFRSVAEWGLYKGICQYFGTTPTWDKYSDEYVSDTIPRIMGAGQTYNVSVTFRNRGVLWREARAFRLGAVGESDPFTSSTRMTISGDVRPGNTYSFNFTMTAPSTPGTYTSDWRMVRDGVGWFGDTLTANITVNPATGPPTIITQPVSQTVFPGDTVNFTVFATGDVPLSYQWRRNGADLSDGGNVSGATTTALTITNVQQSDAGTYTVLVTNTIDSALSAGAVLTVSGHPATWGPYNLTTSRSIYSPANNSTSLRTSWFTTAGGTGASRIIFKADDSTMATMPDASLAAGSSFTVAFTQSGTYISTLDSPVRIYRISQSWTTAAVWNSPWSAGGDYSSVGSASQSVVYPPDLTVYTFPVGAGYNFPYGVMLKGDIETSISYRKGWAASGPYPTLRVNYGTPGPTIRSWAYLGWYDQGTATDRQLRIDTDQVAGTYGGVPVSEANVMPGAGGGGYGNSYGLRQWQAGTYTNDLVNLNSSYFYNAVHENAVTYCFVYVYNSKGSGIPGAYLGIGSDDSCKVWWNGTVVGSDVVGRGVAADSDFWGPVTVNNGWNRLIIKVENGTTGHGVYARFANADRTALTDMAYLSFYTTDDTPPSAPTGLAVAGVTSGIWQNAVAAPTFTWASGSDSQTEGEGVSGVRGQKYYLGTDIERSPNAFQTATSYSPGALADGAYYFKVSTVDSALNESGVETFAFLYDGTPPDVITGFGSSSPGSSDTDWYNSTADLTWTWTAATDASSGLDGYAIVQDTAPATSPDTTVTHDAATINYTLAGPQSSGEYWLHVRGKDAAGNWQSSVTTAHRRVRIDRTAPTGVGLGFGAITTDSITVTGVGADAHSGINAATGYNYSRTGVSDSGPEGATHTWTGLDANTDYSGLMVTVSDQAVPTPNTAASSAQSAWTLSVPPDMASIVPDSTSPYVGSNVTWTAVNGFGSGKVQYYRYAWDTSPAHVWTGAEPQWSGGTIVTVPASAGSWYLHVKGYNGADVENATFDYSITVPQPLPLLTGPVYSAGEFHANLAGLSGQSYVVQASTNLQEWVPVETNTSPFVFSDTNAVSFPFRFYRAQPSP